MFVDVVQRQGLAHLRSMLGVLNERAPAFPAKVWCAALRAAAVGAAVLLKLLAGSGRSVTSAHVCDTLIETNCSATAAAACSSLHGAQ